MTPTRCHCTVPAPGGVLERTLDLPLPPFPGLLVGPLRVPAFTWTDMDWEEIEYVLEHGAE